MAPEIRAQVSIDEFWHLAHRLPDAELIGGQVVELVLPGLRHGVLVTALSRRLYDHVAACGAGIVVSDTGFILSKDPPTVRGPEVAVVFKDRLPSPIPVKFSPGPPDLAVEVLSPDDRPGEVAAEVADYLRAGTRAVWIVDADARTITVHSDGRSATYGRHETLRGAPPLPEFELVTESLFAEVD
jgi:Uma2 family endonuclease